MRQKYGRNAAREETKYDVGGGGRGISITGKEKGAEKGEGGDFKRERKGVKAFEWKKKEKRERITNRRITQQVVGGRVREL